MFGFLDFFPFYNVVSFSFKMLMNAVLPPLSATRTAFATIQSALTTVLANRDTRLQRTKGVKVRDTLVTVQQKTVVGCTILIIVLIIIIIIIIIIITIIMIIIILIIIIMHNNIL